MIQQLSRSRAATSGGKQGIDRISLTLPKNEAFISAVRLMTAGIGMRAGLSYETIEDLRILVTEACTYCIQRGRNDGRLHVALDIGRGAVVVSVSDPGFEPASSVAPTPVMGEYEPDELFIIRNLADELLYRMTPGGGLKLRITKGVG
jgi:serine/threonine-protein kinase RsbW